VNVKPAAWQLANNDYELHRPWCEDLCYARYWLCKRGTLKYWLSESKRSKPSHNLATKTISTSSIGQAKADAANDSSAK
jgi:hypothetical protein